jgi:hypothetical protein
VEFAHETFCNRPTYGGFKEGLADKDPKISSEYNQRILGSGIRTSTHLHLNTLAKRYKDLQGNSKKDGGAILCSIVKDLKPPKSVSLDAHGPIIVVPHFGTIYLGEMLVEKHTRLLSMIRLEMGSPDAARITVAAGEGAPLGYPPQ